jgi:hypothetical protein
VGSYEFSVETPMIAKEQSGIWADGAEAPLPANAATSRDPNQTNAGGNLYLVSCLSAAECTAAGTYTEKDPNFGEQGWFLTNGQNPTPAQLPAGAATFGNSERAGTSPFFGFVGLACPHGHCTALGGYVDGHDDEHGVIFTQHSDGGWGRGIKAPVPANAGRNPAGSNEFENPVASLSCAAAANCAATGWYVNKAKQRRGLLLAEARGKWTASELVLPPGAPRGAIPILGQVTCASPGNCVAIGDYAIGGKTHGLLVVERRGKWSRALRAALPANASKTSHTFLNAVSCASATRCTVVGDYADRSGKTRGLILSLRLS